MANEEHLALLDGGPPISSTDLDDLRLLGAFGEGSPKPCDRAVLSNNPVFGYLPDPFTIQYNRLKEHHQKRPRARFNLQTTRTGRLAALEVPRDAMTPVDIMACATPSARDARPRHP